MSIGVATSGEVTVGQLVVERPSRARVFERLGIDYCCGGKRLLRVCGDKGLSYEAVLRDLEAEQQAGAPAASERDWATASLTELCDHIEQTHHAYLKQELPRLEYLTTRVADRHGDRRPELVRIRQIVTALRAELEQHTAKEERVLFPICRRLDTANAPFVGSHCGSGGSGIASPIQVMTREHDDAGAALAELRELTDNYTPPPDACTTYQATFDALHEFERDMHQHVHKENNILFPRALRAERLLAGR